MIGPKKLLANEESSAIPPKLLHDSFRRTKLKGPDKSGVNRGEKCTIYFKHSIPLLTPLRYPGGKQWFFDRAKEFFERRCPSVLLGPFAGGATVELSLLAANLCDRLILVEKDPRVAAFWRAALGDDRLSKRVAKFEPTQESVCAVLSETPENDLDWAFWVYVKNRTAFNGNLDGGTAKNPRDWRWKDIPIDLYQIRGLGFPHRLHRRMRA